MMEQPTARDRSVGLALETSTRRGSVALGRGPNILAERDLSPERGRASDLLAAVDALFRECGLTPAALERVYVSIGPGSFTGLRIGVMAARMLALACGTGVLGLSTMEVLAYNALEQDTPPRELAVLLDARRDHIYASRFQLANGRYRVVEPPAEVSPMAFLADLPTDIPLLGEGVGVCRSVVKVVPHRALPEALWVPRAEVVYRLGLERGAAGKLDDPRRLVPLYIRRASAEEVWERNRRVDAKPAR